MAQNTGFRKRRKNSMFKPVFWAGASLMLLAELCALPALAQNAGAEAGHHTGPSFSDIDSNADGLISPAEFEAFKPKRPDGDRDRPPPNGHFHGPDLKRLDTDKDGKVSPEEFSAPMKDHFNRLDSNKDGFLDATELKAPPPAD
jgi:hypothetical protein